MNGRMTTLTRLVRTTSFAVGVLLLSILAAACAPAAQVAPTQAPAAPANPAAAPAAPAASPAAGAAAAPRKQGGTLTVDTSAEQILHLDPDQMRGNMEKNILANVYQHLLSRDKDLKIGPALATSWKVADDSVTWTLELRKDVKFHDGTPFNGEAVKANFERWLDPKSLNLNRTNFIQVFDSLEIVDDSTIRIKTKGPQASLPALLSGWGTQIVSPTSIKQSSKEQLDASAVGTGPLKVQAFTPGETLTLVRNDDYWGQKAPLDTVVLKRVAEPSARTAALLTGEVDLSLNVPPSQVARLQTDPNVKILEQPTIRMEIIEFNTTHPPLDKPEVRRALAQAVNWEEIKSVVYEGYRQLFQGPLPPAIFKPDPSIKGLEFNPDAARQQLQAAGQDGLKLRFIHRDTPEHVRLAQLLQQQFQKVGVTLELVRLDQAADTKARADGDFDISVPGYGNSTADPYPTLLAKFNSDPKNISNYARYKSARVDELISKIGAELDETKRAGYLNDLYREYFKDAPWVGASAFVNVNAMNKKVQGLEINAIGDIPLGSMWIE